KVMERRLLNAIITPAMVVSWALGLWLASTGGSYVAGWLQAKVVLVVGLSALHGFFARCVRDFGADRNRPSQKFYRVINEVPTFPVTGSVTPAAVKPFGPRPLRGRQPASRLERCLPPSTRCRRHLRREPSLPILGSSPRTQANTFSTGPSAGAGRCIGPQTPRSRPAIPLPYRSAAFFSHRSPP